MKTISISLITICLLTFCGLGMIKSQPSCPYPVTNNLLCTITVDWTIYDAACVSIRNQTGIVIGAGQTVNVGGACCPNLYDIYITVTNINGTPNGLSPNTPKCQPANGTCTPINSTPTGGCSTGCDSGGLGTYNIFWSTTGAVIQ